MIMVMQEGCDVDYVGVEDKGRNDCYVIVIMISRLLVIVLIMVLYQ